MGNKNYAREKECTICKNMFMVYHPNTKYCSMECKAKGDRLADIAYKQKRKEMEAEKKKRATAVIDIASEAKKAGMSYGKYVALHNL